MNTSPLARQPKKQLGICDEDGAAQAEVTGADAAAPATSGDEARASAATVLSAALAGAGTGGDVASDTPAGVSAPLAAAAEVGAPGRAPSRRPADEQQEDVNEGSQPSMRTGVGSKTKGAAKTKRVRPLSAPKALTEGTPTLVAAGPACRQILEARSRRKRKVMGRSAGAPIEAPTGLIPLCLDGVETMRFLRQCIPSLLKSSWQQQKKQGEEQEAWQQEEHQKQGNEQIEWPPADAHISLAAWSLAHRVLQGESVQRGGPSTSSVCSIDDITSSSSSHPQASQVCSDHCFLALAVPLPVAARVVVAAAFTLDQQQKQQPQPTMLLPVETAAGGTSAVPSSATGGSHTGDENLTPGETSSKLTPPATTVEAAAETPTAATAGTATGGFFPRVWAVCEDDHQAASLTAMLQRFLDSGSGSTGNSSGKPQQQVSASPMRALGNVCCVVQAARTVRQRQQFVSYMKRATVAVFAAPAFAALVTATHFEDGPQQLQRQEQQQQVEQQHQQQQEEQQPQEEHPEESDKAGSSPAVPPKQQHLQPVVEGKKSPQQHQQLLRQQQLMLKACEMLVVQEAPILWKDQSVADALRLFGNSSDCSKQRCILYCTSFLPPSHGELQQWLSEAKAREALIPAAVQQTLQPVSLPPTGGGEAGDGPPCYSRRACRFLLLLLQRQLSRCIRRVGLEDSRLLQLLQQQQQQQPQHATSSDIPGSLATALSTTTTATAAETPTTAATIRREATDEPAAAAPTAASPASPVKAQEDPSIVSISSNSESSSDEDSRCSEDKIHAKPPQASCPPICSSNSEGDRRGVAAVSASLQRYRRLIEAFSTALLEATAGLRQEGLLFPSSKQLKLRQRQQSQQVVRCLGVPEVAITKDDVQAARAAIHQAERRQQQQTVGGKKTPLRCSLLQRCNVKREALVFECRFSMMLLEGRALLGSGGPIVAMEYLEAQAAACTSNTSSSSGTSVEGMHRHLHSRATQQLLSAARAAAATAAASMQRAARRPDLSFGLVMELVLSLLHIFHEDCKNGASISGDGDSGESASSNSSSTTDTKTNKSILLHSIVEGGALVLTGSPEDAAAAATALMNVKGPGFSVQLLEPAALDAAVAAAGSAPCRRRRTAAAVDEARTSSSTSSSKSSTSPCWRLSRDSAGLPKVLLEVTVKTVVVADVATAARGLSCSCRWRLVVLLFAPERPVFQCWSAHRFSAACVDGLYLIHEEQQHQPLCRRALDEVATETADTAASPRTASPSAPCIRRIHSVSPGGYSFPDATAECNSDGLSNPAAAPPRLEELRAAAALGGRRSLVVSVPMTAAAAGPITAATAAADELFEMLHGLKGTDDDWKTGSVTSEASINSCTSSEFVASCSSAVLWGAMRSRPAGPPAGAGGPVETTGCLLLPNRQLLPMDCLFADSFDNAACAGFQLQRLQEVKAQGKRRRGPSPRSSAVSSSSEGCVATSAALGTAAKRDEVEATADTAATMVPPGDVADGCPNSKATEIPGSPVHLGAVDTPASAIMMPTDGERQPLCSDAAGIAAAERGCNAALSPSFSFAPAAKTSSPDVIESQARHRCTLATLSSPTAGAAATAVSADAEACSGSASPPIVLKRQERTPTEVSHCGDHTQDNVGPFESMSEQARPSSSTVCKAEDAVASEPAPSAKKTVTEGASTDSQDSALGVRSTQEERRTYSAAVTPAVGQPKTCSAWPSPSSLCEELHAALVDDDIFSLQLPAGNDRDFGFVPPTAVVATDASANEQSSGSLEPRYGGRSLQDGERGSDNGISGDASGSECPFPTTILAAECVSATSGKSRPVARLRRLRTAEQCGVPTVAQLWWLLPDTEHPLSRFFC